MEIAVISSIALVILVVIMTRKPETQQGEKPKTSPRKNQQLK
jgi:hypothetical protein